MSDENKCDAWTPASTTTVVPEVVIIRKSVATALSAVAGFKTVHPTQDHKCSGVHRDLGGITIHSCACGIEFYYLRDAVSVLVAEHAAMLKFIDKITVEEV